jgi:ribosomal-protein-alanine N-acetyltransferase
MIRVEPITEGWADALAEGDDAFSQRFGVKVEDGWQGFPEVIPFLVTSAHGGGPAEWGPHLIFDEDGALVGNAGWKGRPADGVAELGYSVAPARRGRGIATAVVLELLARGRAAGLEEAIAHTRRVRSPSTSVLTRCGFAKVDELIDPDDGPVWRWSIRLVE